jgi:hypothetical protein
MQRYRVERVDEGLSYGSCKCTARQTSGNAKVPRLHSRFWIKGVL